MITKERARLQFSHASKFMQRAAWFKDKERARKLAEFANIRKARKVLDIACGTGALSSYLCKIGASVIGIDITPSMLAYAKRNCRECGFICADAESLPFGFASGDSSCKLFDICVARASVHHIQNVRSFLREIRKVSNILIIEDTSSSEDPAKAKLHNLIEKTRDPSHNWMYSLTELRRIIESEGYAIAKLREIESDRKFEDWMRIAVADSKTKARCRELLIDSARDGCDDAGLNVKVKGGRITFRHKRFLLKAICK